MAPSTEPAITDRQLHDLRSRLFARKRYDELELEGLVAAHQALGWSHRRRRARARCIEILAELDKDGADARI